MKGSPLLTIAFILAPPLALADGPLTGSAAADEPDKPHSNTVDHSYSDYGADLDRSELPFETSTFDLLQAGSNNSVVIQQTRLDYAGIEQLGTGNTSTIRQLALAPSENRAWITQYGQSDQAHIQQRGFTNTASIIQR